MYLKDTAFQNLMQRRIFNVLLIASPYDAFMMEEDGRVEEQLYFEYVKLNLSSPPRVVRVSNASEASDAMTAKAFDLVVVMPANDISESLAGARAIKEAHPHVPMVVLTPFSKEVSARLEREDLSGIDYVFSWLGNMDLLLAIIKLLEDKMNADLDINEVGVRMSRIPCGFILQYFRDYTNSCSNNRNYFPQRPSTSTNRCCACADAPK